MRSTSGLPDRQSAACYSLLSCGIQGMCWLASLRWPELMQHLEGTRTVGPKRPLHQNQDCERTTVPVISTRKGSGPLQWTGAVTSPAVGGNHPTCAQPAQVDLPLPGFIPGCVVNDGQCTPGLGNSQATRRQGGLGFFKKTALEGSHSLLLTNEC